MIFPPCPLATKLLSGLKGVEIGGSAHNQFYLDTINVDVCAEPDPFYKQQQVEMCGSYMPVDVVSLGDSLPFHDNAYDFVINSHCIEHFFNPVKAIKEWIRVSNKYVFMIVPHKERTFDSPRKLTTVEKLIAINNGDITVEQAMDKNHKNFDADYHSLPFNHNNLYGHWTVWTSKNFAEMCNHFGFKILHIDDRDLKVGNGFTVILAANDGVELPAEERIFVEPEPPRRRRRT